jgi:hypothetical protein
MLRKIAPSLLALVFLSPIANAAEDKIDSALSAAPASISRDAKVMDWDGTVLREGSNAYTCLPDIPNNGANDPWCVDEPWLNLLNALKNKIDPTYTKIGIAYMLQGDGPVSNTDPFATSKTTDADWVEGLGAHLMILVPNRDALNGISVDAHNGGPWIMWPDTPYAHLMIPIDAYPE